MFLVGRGPHEGLLAGPFDYRSQEGKAQGESLEDSRLREPLFTENRFRMRSGWANLDRSAIRGLLSFRIFLIATAMR